MAIFTLSLHRAVFCKNTYLFLLLTLLCLPDSKAQTQFTAIENVLKTPPNYTDYTASGNNIPGQAGFYSFIDILE